MPTAPLAATLIVGLLASASAAAQTPVWTSTDVGAVTVAGSAGESNGVWTVSGSGADIWNRADAFQFLHQPSGFSGFLSVRVIDLENTNPYAKAGLMLRAGLSADAAMAIFDVKPNGELEFMARPETGADVQYLSGSAGTTPAWLGLGWSGRTVTGWTSTDGIDWTPFRIVDVAIAPAPEAGIAVTSHDPATLNTAHFESLSLAASGRGWRSTDVGEVGAPGSASENNGVWTVTGAGADIWGTADAFQFLHRSAFPSGQYLMVRVDDLQDTNPFAKAGLMLRTGLDAGAPTVILDVKPDGQVEFMTRGTQNGTMFFIAGTTVTTPVWLRLSWAGDASIALVTASVSQDKVHWSDLAPQAVLPVAPSLQVGVAVTSHHEGLPATAHFRGLSLLYNQLSVDEIGNPGLVGSAVNDAEPENCCYLLAVEGAGADIWGTADSFEFVHGLPETTYPVQSIEFWIPGLDAAHRFAKAGLMFRDSLDPAAAHVIVDAKPDGGIEFMARQCTGCETTYIAGATMRFPVSLTLRRNGSTFQADVTSGISGDYVNLGTVDVAMPAPIGGLAVTSHDTAHIATTVFAEPPR
jgi:hypothetical protein